MALPAVLPGSVETTWRPVTVLFLVLLSSLASPFAFRRVQAQTHPSDVATLEAFKRSCLPHGLASWNRTGSDPCGAAQTSSQTNYDSSSTVWEGIFSCVRDTNDPNVFRISELFLQEHNMTCPFPSMLMNLTYLKALNLGGNPGITGNIPSSIEQLTLLQTFDFHGCSLTGQMPLEIAQILSLQNLLLNGNKLTGIIPREFGALSNLFYFDISWNQIEGPIPVSPGLDQLVSAGHLHMSNNKLTNLPGELGGLPNLIHLMVDYNSIEGQLPLGLGNFQKLLVMHLSGNSFFGSIPNEYFLPTLTDFSASGCSLNGPLPDIGKSVNLESLDLSYNSFTGSFPSAIGTTVNGVYTLNLANNLLSGTVPPLDSLQNLQTLLLSYNNFTSSIPALTPLTNLESADFSFNDFDSFPDLESFLNSHPEGTLVELSGNPLCSAVSQGSNNGQQKASKGTKELLKACAPPATSSSLEKWTAPGICVPDPLNKNNGSKEEAENSLPSPSSSSSSLSSESFNRRRLLFVRPVRTFLSSSSPTASPSSSPASNSSPLVPCQNSSLPSTYFFNISLGQSCICVEPIVAYFSFPSTVFAVVGPKLASVISAALKKALTPFIVLDPSQIRVAAINQTSPTNSSASVSQISQISTSLSARVEIYPNSTVWDNNLVIRVIQPLAAHKVSMGPQLGPYSFFIMTLPYGNSSYPYSWTLPASLSTNESANGGSLLGKGQSSSGFPIGYSFLIGALALLSVIALTVLVMRKLYRDKGFNNNLGFPPDFKIQGLRNFRLSELKECTDDFTSVLGEGGYGTVYFGILPTGEKLAIKRSKRQVQAEDVSEFKNEIELLSRVRHRNLVLLIGFCFENGKQMLVFEYLARGTLYDLIQGLENDPSRKLALLEKKQKENQDSTWNNNDGNHSTGRRKSGSFFAAFSGDSALSGGGGSAGGASEGDSESKRGKPSSARKSLTLNWGGFSGMVKKGPSNGASESILSGEQKGALSESSGVENGSVTTPVGNDPGLVLGLSSGANSGTASSLPSNPEGSNPASELFLEKAVSMKILSWEMRVNIALGSARGLAYLHNDIQPPIIHRDIKSSNILIDENWNAKVSDFGLSKIHEDEENGGEADFTKSEVKGTIGYLDPEYYTNSKLSEKSDVYSFGVVLLELITGRKPVQSGQHVLKWVKNLLAKKCGVADFSLPEMKGFDEETVMRMTRLALRCTLDSQDKRPDTRDIVHELDLILQIIQNSLLDDHEPGTSSGIVPNDPFSFEQNASDFDAREGSMGRDEESLSLEEAFDKIGQWAEEEKSTGTTTSASSRRPGDSNVGPVASSDFLKDYTPMSDAHPR